MQQLTECENCGQLVAVERVDNGVCMCWHYVHCGYGHTACDDDIYSNPSDIVKGLLHAVDHFLANNEPELLEPVCDTYNDLQDEGFNLPQPRSKGTPLEELLYCIFGWHEDYGSRNYGLAQNWHRHIKTHYEDYYATINGTD